jgi:hypothetical protein
MATMAQIVTKVLELSHSHDEISFEFPGLCGTSKVSGGRCKGHGHLSLSVADETVRDVAFRGISIPILITIPRIIWTENISPLFPNNKDDENNGD